LHTYIDLFLIIQLLLTNPFNYSKLYKENKVSHM
jgi:hypothetical protein